jgi:Na+-transporting NADH:ubiquinone oxidoreductase subunit A
MLNQIKVKRGLDIAISGSAALETGTAALPDIISIIPDHYHGIVPKITLRTGDRVQAGTAVFQNKRHEAMNFVSPVSGEIVAVNRGERRKLLSIDIKRDNETEYKKFDFAKLESLSAGEVKSLLLESGLWVYIKQRPYDVIANPDSKPKAVFISAFDSAPLAPSAEFMLKSQYADFQTGINALAKIADCKIHLGLRAGSKNQEFCAVKNVEITEYSGAHPAGNVGVHINRLAPVNKGETVWTLGVRDVLFIGRFFNTGKVNLQMLVALAGTEVIEPKYYKTLPGASIENIVKGNVYMEIPLRYIDGNVLSGRQIAGNGIVSPYTTLITVISEGSETHEFAGWAMPRFDRFSSTALFFTKILQNRFVEAFLGKPSFKWDARILGGQRGIIMSGEYDKVFPFDILPEYLIKAMIAKNIEKMENLGAYEIAPEDFALCEFVDTSKLPLQNIVREALDYLKQEVE